MQHRKGKKRMGESNCASLWMLSLLIKATAAAEAVLLDERGQDLIEYALVAALISLAATVSMSSVAKAITNAFTNIGSHFAVYSS
jgi:pilus assembly protein Flp/PilA